MPLGRRIDRLSKKQPPQREKETEKTDTSPDKLVDLANNENIIANSLFRSETPKYSFSDIILNESTYGLIQDVLVLYEKKEFLFQTWGLASTHPNKNRAGINLYGPPGTGKSMVAHAIAKQLKRQLLTVDYSQIESKYVGETAKNLVAMFDYAKKSESIIFFDEADALLSRRVTNMSNSTDVSVNQTRSVLLVLINEFDDLILFASNFISNYDPAFMRRITAHIKFELPDEQNRLRLWRMYIPQKMPTDVNLNLLAEKYSGISGSDISNAVLNACLRAARLDEPMVRHAYFEAAIERIISSKIDNDDTGEFVSKRVVSEDYVKSQFEGGLPK